MNKIFTIVLACLSSIAVMAVDYTAYGIISLNAISSGVDAKIKFFEAPDYVNGPAYDDGADTPEPMTGQELYFYAVGSDNNYMIYADKKLHNIPLAIKGTATDTQYKFVFSNWTYNAGQTYKLYDKQENVWIDLVNTTAPYSFTITAGSTVADRFVIEPILLDPTICHQKGNLIITGHQGAKVKVLDMADQVAIAEQTLATDDEVISLSSLTKGDMYKVIVDEGTPMLIRIQ